MIGIEFYLLCCGYAWTNTEKSIYADTRTEMIYRWKTTERTLLDFNVDNIEYFKILIVMRMSNNIIFVSNLRKVEEQGGFT